MRDINKLRGVIELFLENSSRINEKQEQKYWYPLSLATYDADEIIEALDSMCAFRTTMWEKTQKFEKEFASYMGCKEAVMVNSGSSADLILAHLAKDEVVPGKTTIIVPSVTWPTQIWSAINAGFDVRLVDVDPKTLNIDLGVLDRAIDDTVGAIFLVHLMGNPCNVPKIQEIIGNRNILLIEDCCEALGADISGTRVGNFGFGGSYSFFFSHHITTMEGGMIVLNSSHLAEKARILRAHGWSRNVDTTNLRLETDPRYTFLDMGFNLRPTELQASFGIHQLKKLDHFNQLREQFSEMIFNYVDFSYWLSRPISFGNPSWLGIPIMVNEDAPFTRDEIVQYLEQNGIETRPIVAGNIIRHPASRKIKMDVAGGLVGADKIHNRGFYIGLSPMLNENLINKLKDLLNNFMEQFYD